MTDDLELLRCYTTRDRGAQAAFAELVQRHLNLVYSVARRITGSPQLAEDVAQSVFTDLATRGRSLPPGTPVVAWLHVVSRRTAIDTVRRESRRQRREKDAGVLATTLAVNESHASWSSIEPLLDEAVAALAPPDRTAVLLRFFQNKSFREVGAALGASDDAAQKRVSRALDQLRDFLLRRGLTVTSAGLAGDLLAHATLTAPAALGTLVVSAGATAATSSLIVMTTFQKTLLSGAAALALGGAVFEGVQLRASRAALDATAQQLHTLETEAAALRRRRDVARQRLAAADPAPVTLTTTALAPEDAAMAAEIQAWFSRVADARQLASQRPDLTIPEMKLLTDDDWHAVGDIDPSRGAVDTAKMLSSLRLRAKNLFGNRLRSALNAYLSAHDGNLPDHVNQLAPFFSPTPDSDMLDRYVVVRRGKQGDLATAIGRPVITEKPSDSDDPVIGVTAVGFTMGSVDLRAHAANANDRFQKVTGGNLPVTAANLLPFFDPPLTPKLQEKFLQGGSRFLPKPPSK